MANLFARKPLDKLMAEAQEVGEHSLKRSLGATNLVMLGIGGIIGAGLFVRTAAAIADRAGPSVVLAFILAGVGCAFAGLCYAEFASMIPVAGSAYTYSYATMGEFIAWIIGWDLVLEYAVGAATVAIAASRCGGVKSARRSPLRWKMPLGRFDHPALFWVLLKSNVTFARSASLSVARNAFAAATTFGVTALVAGGAARCANPAANRTPSGRRSESRGVFTALR